VRGHVGNTPMRTRIRIINRRVPVPMTRSWVALFAVVADRIDGKAEKQCSRRTMCDLCAGEPIGQRSAARKAGQGRRYY